ncbi:MAG: hypothetical protein HOP19_09435 [Acidobacteria bacterium]|nr:hypothetical protein [Acidobacteriota bacterium]
MAHLVIGTRSDALAVRQASFIKSQIEHTHAGLQVALELLASETSLHQSGDWLNEASLALLARRVDVIVHHLCDLSPRLPEDIHLAAVVERTDACDALLVNAALRATVHSLADLPAEARVIAQGDHRRAQIAAQHPQVSFLATNTLEQALHQLAAHACDAVVADALSLSLLQADEQITARLDATEFIPAVGQGVLVLQSRIEDQRTNLILESLNHTPTRHAANAERAALRNLYGEPGDAIAITAAHSISNGSPQLTLTGVVADASATPVQLIRATIKGDALAPDLCGSALAVALLNAGARTLLTHTRTNQAVNAQVNELAELYPMSFGQEFFAEPAAPLRQAASAFSGAGAWPIAETSSPRLAAFHETAAPEFDLVASKVSRLRQHQPLHGRRILLAAARSQDELAQQLEALGASVMTLPRLRAAEPASWEPLDKVLLHISWYDWLIFANAASVTACLNRCAVLGHHQQEIEARRLCAVGKAAANSLRTAELSPDLVLPQFNADTLAAEWEARFGQHEPLRGKTMLLLTAQNHADEFAQTTRSPLRTELDQLGVYVEAVATHQYSFKNAAHLWETAFDYALFFDASSVETMATLCAPRSLPEILSYPRIACLSHEAYKTAQAHGLAASLRLTQNHPPALVKWLREDSAQRARSS